MVGGASTGVGREEGAGNLLERVEEARARLDTAQPETLIALHRLEQKLAEELTVEFRANPQVRAILAGSSKDLVASTAPGSFGEYASAREDLLSQGRPARCLERKRPLLEPIGAPERIGSRLAR